MPVVYVYDFRDFSFALQDSNGDALPNSVLNADPQPSDTPQTVWGGTLEMTGGVRANVSGVNLEYLSVPIETGVSEDQGLRVIEGKTLFGDTDLATDETVVFTYTILIYDPANPSVEIELYALARNDGDASDNHTIIGLASQVPLDPSVQYVIGRFEDSEQPGIYEDQVYPGDLTPDPENPVCFAAGTKIRTDRGDVFVEDLKVGDLVYTVDRGLQPVRWIKERKITSNELILFANMRPVRIRRGSLGVGMPSEDLLVSPQHRVLVRSKVAERMFDSAEILVAAKHLCGVNGIEIATDIGEVTYYHMVFDQHEIVVSNGALTESLYTGTQALKAIGNSALEELYSVMPELRVDNYKPNAARMLVNGRHGRQLAKRHIKNGKPLYLELQDSRTEIRYLETT